MRHATELDYINAHDKISFATQTHASFRFISNVLPRRLSQ